MEIRNIAENIQSIHEKLHMFELGLVESQAAFNEHTKQDAKMYHAIEDLRDSQFTMATQLGEYNGQLKVHIAGVQELKSMNANLIHYINTVKEDIDANLSAISERVETTEAPLKWFLTTKKVVYVLWSIGAAMAAAYAFYYQVWAVKPVIKPLIPTTITKIVE